MAEHVSNKTVLIVLLLAVVGSCFVFSRDSVVESAANSSEVTPEIWARMGCEGAVKSQLKAPTTAQFEWKAFGNNPAKDEPYAYATLGKVTSQNAYRAMLTKDFICYSNGQQDFRGKAVVME